MHPKQTGGFWSFDLYYIGETEPAAAGDRVDDSSEKQVLLDLHNEARSEPVIPMVAFFFRKVILSKLTQCAVRCVREHYGKSAGVVA